ERLLELPFQELQAARGVGLRGVDRLAEAVGDGDQVVNAHVDQRQRVVQEAERLELAEEMVERLEAGDDVREVEVEVLEVEQAAQAGGVQGDVWRSTAERVAQVVDLQNELDAAVVQARQVRADVDGEGDLAAAGQARRVQQLLDVAQVVDQLGQRDAPVR